MKKTFATAGLAALAAFALALPAEAHTLGAAGAGFVHGFGHPLGGLDHLLAMIAVGVWAGQLGGRSVWLVPAAFVAMLAVGAALGLGGLALPAVEAGIAASVVVLGILIALRQRLPAVAGMAIVGAFALFHGHAHGAEMPAAASPLLYGLGFVMATALLHGVGIGLSALVGRLASGRLVRVGGAALAAAGLGIAAGF